jgi:hypothetical protein
MVNGIPQQGILMQAGIQRRPDDEHISLVAHELLALFPFLPSAVDGRSDLPEKDTISEED